MEKSAKEFFKTLIKNGSGKEPSKALVAKVLPIIQKPIADSFDKLKISREVTPDELSFALSELSIIVRDFGNRNYQLTKDSLFDQTNLITKRGIDGENPRWYELSDEKNKQKLTYISELQEVLRALGKSPIYKNKVTVNVEGVKASLSNSQISFYTFLRLELKRQQNDYDNRFESEKKSIMVSSFSGITLPLLLKYLRANLFVQNSDTKLKNHEAFLIGLIYAGAGYLDSYKEYELNKRTKEYTKVLDKEHYKKTGIKKYVTRAKPYSYYQFLYDQVLVLNKKTKHFNTAFFNIIWK